MFKSIYTTRMSDDGKTLKRRFEKINSKISVKAKILAVILTLLIAVLAIVVILTLSRTEFVYIYGMDDYAEFTESNNLMPKSENLGEYEAAEFRHFHKERLLGFDSDAYTLIVKYNEEEYEKEKYEIDTEYIGFKKFELDNFDFTLVESNQLNSINIPKEMLFVGISNSTYEIAYVYFYDDDFDYMDKNYAEFLIKDCGWNAEKKYVNNTADSYELIIHDENPDKEYDELYEITFRKDNSDVLYNRTFDYRHEIEEVEKGLFNVHFWVGTNASYDVFVDTKNDRVSEEYFNILCYADETVVYCEDNVIVIDEMFGTEKLCIDKLSRDFSETFTLRLAITYAEIKDGKLCLKYLTGKDFKEVYEEFAL